MAERCDWYDELYQIPSDHAGVWVGDAVWLESLVQVGQFPNGEVLSIDRNTEIVVVGIYGRYNSDPHFTGIEEVDLSDFEQWGECRDGRSGRRWKIHTFLV